MSASVGDSYREGDILTAPPQRLHLMLIEGAIKFIERTRHLWRTNQPDAGFEALIRAQEIVGEILAGIKTETGGDLAKRVAALYTFVYRCLVQASLSRDEKPLEDALRVLAIERETWQELCRRLAQHGIHKDEVRLSSETQVEQTLGDGSDLSSLPVHSRPGPPLSARNLTSVGTSEYPGEYTSGVSWEA